MAAVKKTTDTAGEPVLVATPQFMNMTASAKVAEIERLCGDAVELQALTDAERRVVFAGMAGMRSAEIAELTGQAATTVDVLRSRAVRKTGSSTLAHLATRILRSES